MCPETPVWPYSAPAGSPAAARWETAAEGGPRESLRLLTLRELGPLRGGVAAAAVIAALLAAWAQWQPQRSADASQEALALSASDPNGARSAAQAAVNHDPLSAEALFALSTIQQHSGQAALARSTLVQAVHLQPSNPQTWQTLGEYDLRMGNPKAALNELRATVFLNPEAVAPLSAIEHDPGLLAIQNAYLQALRETPPPPAALTSRPKAQRPAKTRPANLGLRTATGGRSPTTAAARRAALRRFAPQLRESQSLRAAP